MAKQKQLLIQKEERAMAVALLRYDTPIERESYCLLDGGLYEFGLFTSFDGAVLFAQLFFFSNGQIRIGTVRKFKEADGLNWFQDIKHRWDSRA
jgi:hypothetical protein